MLRWTTALSIALATSAAALPAHAQVWVPAWTASPAPDRQDGTPEAPVQFAHQTVRQDMRLASSATALRFRISNELGDAPLTIGGASAQRTGTATRPSWSPSMVAAKWWCRWAPPCSATRWR